MTQYVENRSTTATFVTSIRDAIVNEGRLANLALPVGYVPDAAAARVGQQSLLAPIIPPEVDARLGALALVIAVPYDEGWGWLDRVVPSGAPIPLWRSGITNQSGSSPTHVLNFPRSTTPGDLLVAAIHYQAGATTTWPAGWTEVADFAVPASERMSVGWKIADGTEGSTVTITTSTGVQGSYITGQFPKNNVVDYAIHSPQFSSPVTGTNSDPNPPAVNPTWDDALQTHFATFVGYRQPAIYAAPPPGYVLIANVNHPSTGESNMIGAEKVGTGSTEDPGAFDFSTDAPGWGAITMAVLSEILVT